VWELNTILKSASQYESRRETMREEEEDVGREE
jgi:hypothetical protein